MENLASQQPDHPLTRRIADNMAAVVDDDLIADHITSTLSRKQPLTRSLAPDLASSKPRVPHLLSKMHPACGRILFAWNVANQQLELTFANNSGAIRSSADLHNVIQHTDFGEDKML